MRYAKLLLLLPLLLTACAPEIAPTPTPRAAYVATTPAYQDWLESYVRAYWEIVPGNGVIPLTYPLSAAFEAVEAQEAEMIISASTPPEDWFAAVLGFDAIAVLVHADIEINDLNFEELRAIFAGDLDNWSELTTSELAIQPIIPLVGDEIRVAFQARVMKGARYSSNASLAPNPQIALELLGDTPGAITIIPYSSLPDPQEALRVEGVQASLSTTRSDRYPLTLELLAIAPEEPSGAMRDFLGWLQAELLATSDS
jgi:phosphate transport system substrate-binding protein